MTVDVRGARELQRALKTLPKEYSRELATIHKSVVGPVVKEAKQLVPRVSGDLANSIRALGSKKSGRAAAGKASVPYAGPIHFGWPARNIRPQPFLTTALERKRDEVLVEFVKKQDALIDKVWRAAGL